MYSKSTCKIVALHRQNILLDGNLSATLADFGFAMELPTALKNSGTLVTAVSGCRMGWTRGYMAPEFTLGRHEPPSDVYSYGVVNVERTVRYPCVYSKV